MGKGKLHVDLERKIIDGFSKEIAERFQDHVLTIRLFGSRATGKAQFDSDYDFLIITENKNPTLKTAMYDAAYDYLLTHQIVWLMMILMTPFPGPITPLQGIALNLKAEDVLEIMELSNLRISKHELSAFFRNPAHKYYRDCKDQILRNFLKGLQLKYRPNI